MNLSEKMFNGFKFYLGDVTQDYSIYFADLGVGLLIEKNKKCLELCYAELSDINAGDYNNFIPSIEKVLELGITPIIYGSIFTFNKGAERSFEEKMLESRIEKFGKDVKVKPSLFYGNGCDEIICLVSQYPMRNASWAHLVSQAMIDCMKFLEWKGKNSLDPYNPRLGGHKTREPNFTVRVPELTDLVEGLTGVDLSHSKLNFPLVIEGHSLLREELGKQYDWTSDVKWYIGEKPYRYKDLIENVILLKNESAEVFDKGIAFKIGHLFNEGSSINEIKSNLLLFNIVNQASKEQQLDLIEVGKITTEYNQNTPLSKLAVGYYGRRPRFKEIDRIFTAYNLIQERGENNLLINKPPLPSL